MLCSSMLIATFTTEIPKPTPAIATSARGIQPAFENTITDTALTALPMNTACPREPWPRWWARNTVPRKAPQPAAPQITPRVPASPPNTSRANTGSSTA